MGDENSYNQYGQLKVQPWYMGTSVVDNDDNVITRPVVEKQLARPRKYALLYMNDDFTPMDFVQWTLEFFINKSQLDAARITADVHVKGIGMAEIYPSFDIAETKKKEVETAAKGAGHPLRLLVEAVDE